MDIGCAKHRNHQPHTKSGKETDGCKAFCQFPVSGSDQSRDVVAGADADHEGQCLNDGHCGKNNAHGTGGTGPELTYKKSIRHVVDGCHQHTDDGRNGQLRDHASYRRMGHFIVLVMCFFRLFHDNISCRVVVSDNLLMLLLDCLAVRHNRASTFPALLRSLHYIINQTIAPCPIHVILLFCFFLFDISPCIDNQSQCNDTVGNEYTEVLTDGRVTEEIFSGGRCNDE